MFTLNEMLIFFFERNAVGEYPTVVLYKYIKKDKKTKQKHQEAQQNYRTGYSAK